MIVGAIVACGSGVADGMIRVLVIVGSIVACGSGVADGKIRVLVGSGGGGTKGACVHPNRPRMIKSIIKLNLVFIFP